MNFFFKDFRRRFLNLLSYQFHSFHSSLALSVLQQKSAEETAMGKLTVTTVKNKESNDVDAAKIAVCVDFRSFARRIIVSFDELRFETFGIVRAKFSRSSFNYGLITGRGSFVFFEKDRRPFNCCSIGKTEIFIFC